MPVITIQPIGVIHTPFSRPEGTPIQPAVADGAEGWIEVDEEYTEGLTDLARFERIWLLYLFDRVCDVRLKVVPFRDTVERGVFATRAPCRPNRIGLSPVRLLAVEGNRLRVADVDMLDGTPLLDIKPYAPRFDVFADSRSGWLDNGTDRTKADRRFEDNKQEEDES